MGGEEGREGGRGVATGGALAPPALPRPGGAVVAPPRPRTHFASTSGFGVGGGMD